MARPGLREMPNDRESGPQPGLSSCDEAAHGPPKKLFRIPTKRAYGFAVSRKLLSWREVAKQCGHPHKLHATSRKPQAAKGQIGRDRLAPSRTDGATPCRTTRPCRTPASCASPRSSPGRADPRQQVHLVAGRQGWPLAEAGEAGRQDHRLAGRRYPRSDRTSGTLRGVKPAALGATGQAPALLQCGGGGQGNRRDTWHHPPLALERSRAGHGLFPGDHPRQR
jgi:hypothetical protein